jgi:hypothetical protein
VVKTSNPLKHPLVKQSSDNPHHLTNNKNKTPNTNLISFPHLLSGSVNPAARRAACGEAAAMMTAGEKALKQIRAPHPPAVSVRKSRPESSTPYKSCGPSGQRLPAGHDKSQRNDATKTTIRDTAGGSYHFLSLTRRYPSSPVSEDPWLRPLHRTRNYRVSTAHEAVVIKP